MEKPEVVRVLVVDGSHAVRTGIRQWLANESDLVVVGMPCSAVEAIRQVSDLRVCRRP